MTELEKYLSEHHNTPGLIAFEHEDREGRKRITSITLNKQRCRLEREDEHSITFEVPYIEPDAECDKHPTPTSAYVPVGDNRRAMISAYTYSDGRTSSACMSDDKWLALPVELREKTTIPAEYLETTAPPSTQEEESK